MTTNFERVPIKRNNGEKVLIDATVKKHRKLYDVYLGKTYQGTYDKRGVLRFISRNPQFNWNGDIPQEV